LPDDRPERPDEDRSSVFELTSVVGRKIAQDSLAMRGQPQPHDAAVDMIAFTRHEFIPNGPVHQFHHRVVSQMQTVCGFADRQAIPSVARLDSQDELVLLRIEPRVSRGAFTEGQESADHVPELV
jgi:hypothetical protein